MNVNDIYQIRVACTMENQTSINVWHYRIGNITTAGITDAEFARALSSGLNAAFKAVLNVGARFNGVGVRRIYPLPTGLEAADVADAGPGTVTLDALPKQTAGLIRVRGPFAGRRYMGRMFVPFPSESDNGALGVPSGSYVARLATLATELFTTDTIVGAGGTARYDPVIWHRDTQTADNILTTQVVTAWATQRRRGYFGRPNPSPF